MDEVNEVDVPEGILLAHLLACVSACAVYKSVNASSRYGAPTGPDRAATADASTVVNVYLSFVYPNLVS